MALSGSADALSTNAKAASAALKKLRSTMLQSTLTPQERSEYAPIRVTRGMRTLEVRLKAAMQHQDLLPASVDLRAFEQDAQLARALKECLTLVKETEQAVSDTLLVVGSHAVEAATVIYGHLKLASVSGQGANRQQPARRSRRARSAAATKASSAPPAVPSETPTQAEVSTPAPVPAPESASPITPGNVVDAPSSAVPTRNAA